MDKIKELFEEIKELESLSKIYKGGKKDIDILENEINELKTLRSTIDVDSLESQIQEYEIELANIAKEIECASIMKNTCLTLPELEKMLSIIDDNEKCLEKCIGFMNSLIVTYNLTSESVQSIFDIDKDENNLIIIKIRKEIERLFYLVKDREFSSDLKHDFKQVISKTLNNSVPFDIDIFISNDSLYFIIPSTESSSDESLNVKNPTKTTFESIYTDFPILTESILIILKSNLSKSLFNDEYTLVDMIENNNKMKNTPFYINEIQEWALDMAIKEINTISKNKESQKDIYPIEDRNTGKYISIDYYKLSKISKFIRKIESPRKSKAISFFEKAILKFFDVSKCDSQTDYFTMYSDITHFIKKANDIDESADIFKNINDIREDLFYKIMKTSTSIEIDLNEPILRLKAVIKQKQFDFDENVDNFISPQTQKFFKIQFFEKIYGNFIGFILKPRKYSTKDKAVLKELTQYLMDISFDLDPESIVNYEKMVSFCNIFGSSLEEVIDMYEWGNINLDKNELRTIVRFVFEDSDLREEFINTLM